MKDDLPNIHTHRPLTLKEHAAFKSFLSDGTSQAKLARVIGTPARIVRGAMEGQGVPHSEIAKVRAFMVREGFTRVSTRYSPPLGELARIVIEDMIAARSLGPVLRTRELRHALQTLIMDDHVAVDGEGIHKTYTVTESGMAAYNRGVNTGG